jgi:hypothetical protein
VFVSRNLEFTKGKHASPHLLHVGLIDCRLNGCSMV